MADVSSSRTLAVGSMNAAKAACAYLGLTQSLAKRDNDHIIDIRRSTIEHSVRDDMLRMLQPKLGQEKRMPTLLLYDEAGLKLFEQITYLDQYYLTNAEIETLTVYAAQIARRIRPGSMVVELGSGNLRKVNILLQALEDAGKDVEYYALDLSLAELQRTLADVPTTYKHVRCYGLHGTYDDGLAWLQQPQNAKRPKCIVSLGSSIGNFTRDEAAHFLAGFAQILRRDDYILVGLDACRDKDKVFHAYNDRHGVTHAFLRNGLTQANSILGKTAFKPDEWTVFGEYDEEAGRHQAFYSPIKDVEIDKIKFSAGERVRVEESYKYSLPQSGALWARAGLQEGARWANGTACYFLHMLSRPTFAYSLDPSQYAAAPVPSYPKDWDDLWAAWDVVTTGMIPKSALLSKPIKLRNACIFYLGHIPCFLDLHLARATDGVLTTPTDYPRIFERGIDPDVDNPDHCHSHSEIPDSWPPFEDILAYQSRVRQRVRTLYENNKVEADHGLARALWIGFEHEILHLETLLYMLVQSDSILPPPGGVRPDFEAMAAQAKACAVPNEWISVPETEVTLGMDDAGNDSGPMGCFGWDNEIPARHAKVRSFVAKARPITNEEYARYLEQTHNERIPASWAKESKSNGVASSDRQMNGFANGAHSHENAPVSQTFLAAKSVRTLYGLVPLSLALDWPVMASYDELASCAKWMNGRIPSLEEVRSIYQYAVELKARDADKVLAKRIAAVNGHLSNEGVEESPPSHPLQNGFSSSEHGPDPNQSFTNLKGCNVGFKHWHPVPVTQNGNRLSGQGDFGGAWEWTSSVLEKHDGFKPMDLYPAYTADFFDHKHNVMLGGSWATHPRVAGRKSFVNWYQRNYPYAWASARLIRDA